MDVLRDERMIPVPGGRLYAVGEGDGPPIVLLHAGVVDSRVWEPFVPLLTDAGYRTIRYDARGFGRSETEDVEFSRVDDLLAVLDAFGIERAALVGNSQGGQIALDLAVSRPDRVAALVQLASGIGGLDVPMSPSDEAVEQRYEEVDQAGDLEALTDFELALWGAGVDQPVERLSARATRVPSPDVRARERGGPRVRSQGAARPAGRRTARPADDAGPVRPWGARLLVRRDIRTPSRGERAECPARRHARASPTWSRSRRRLRPPGWSSTSSARSGTSAEPA